MTVPGVITLPSGESREAVRFPDGRVRFMVPRPARMGAPARRWATDAQAATFEPYREA